MAVEAPGCAPLPFSRVQPGGSTGWHATKERRKVCERVRAWLDVTDEGDTLILSLHGEMDVAAVPTIEPVVIAAVTTAETVVVDLVDVDFCDSSGVAMFFAIARRADAEDTVLSVRNTPTNVRRVFEIAGLDREVDVRD